MSPELSTSGHGSRALPDRVIRAESRAPFPRPRAPSPKMSSDSDDGATILQPEIVFGRRLDGKMCHNMKLALQADCM